MSEAKPALEKLRAKVAGHAHNYITAKNVLVGDSVAELLMFSLPDSHKIIHSSIEELARQLCVSGFSSRTQDLMIVTGTDELNADEPVTEILESCRRLAAEVSKFTHITVTWMAPPYHHGRQQDYYELLGGLGKLLTETPIVYALVGLGYRSSVETVRYGDSYDHRLIDDKGHLKPGGARKFVYFHSAVFDLPFKKPKEFLDRKLEKRGKGDKISAPVGQKFRPWRPMCVKTVADQQMDLPAIVTIRAPHTRKRFS